jgi:hypothetical protein
VFFAGDYGNAMVIICKGEAVVHHAGKETLETSYYHARVESWRDEGAARPRCYLHTPHLHLHTPHLHLHLHPLVLPPLDDR